MAIVTGWSSPSDETPPIATVSAQDFQPGLRQRNSSCFRNSEREVTTHEGEIINEGETPNRPLPVTSGVTNGSRPVLRQKKSSYFHNWKQHIPTQDGKTVNDHPSPIESAVQQQDIISAAFAGQPQAIPEIVLSEDAERQKPQSSETERASIGLWITAASIALTVFLVALDDTIITTAIPTITRKFDSSDDIGWYGSAYLLTACGFRMLYGKLYAMFPIKIVLLCSIVIFEAGSLISGLAPISLVLIFGRAISGIGAAGIGTGFPVILVRVAPSRLLPILTSTINSVYGVASVAAPLIGGLLTTKVSWRWCFLANLPLGGCAFAAILLAARVPHISKTSRWSWSSLVKDFDILGLTGVLAGTTLLLLAVQWGGSKYGWQDARIIILILLSVGLFGIFGFSQYRWPATATLPGRVACQRSVCAATIFAFAIGTSATTVEYFLPIWFQTIKGMSPIDAGERVLPTILGFVVFALLAGSAVSIFGYYVPFMIAGSIFLSLGSGLLTTINKNSGTAKWVGYQILIGAGGGFGVEQPYIAAMTVLGTNDIPAGISLVSFAQTLGSALSISVAQTVFTASYKAGVVAAKLSSTSQLASGGAASSPPELEDGVKGELLGITNAAITRTFFITVAASSCAMIPALAMEWVSVKKENKEQARTVENEKIEAA